MSTFRLSPVLRRVLLADAVISGATGLLMFVGADVLMDALNLPAALLRSAGLVLLPYAVFVAFVAIQNRLHRAAVLAVITINALWAVDSFILLFSGWVVPNAFGYAFVVAQAIVVALFAELQYMAMRRTITATA